ncbi:MAG: YabP/YqfC family sporulation protein [Erysipelotrichales bacterium]|nr:YabP/YqfC family sporulation protein [Erysipelotrichales bacterium]
MLLIDDNQIYIKDYKEILNLDQNMFYIQMDKYDLLVKGEKLEMLYYDHQEIRLNGQVKVIEYHENRV